MQSIIWIARHKEALDHVGARTRRRQPHLQPPNYLANFQIQQTHLSVLNESAAKVAFRPTSKSREQQTHRAKAAKQGQAPDQPTPSARACKLISSVSSGVSEQATPRHREHECVRVCVCACGCGAGCTFPAPTTRSLALHYGTSGLCTVSGNRPAVSLSGWTSCTEGPPLPSSVAVVLGGKGGSPLRPAICHHFAGLTGLTGCRIALGAYFTPSRLNGN